MVMAPIVRDATVDDQFIVLCLSVRFAAFSGLLVQLRWRHCTARFVRLQRF